jgi:predicted permease
MTSPLLLLPDFLLILIGWLVCRWTALDRPIWEAAEKLVYYLLFPVLLFNSTLTSPLHPAQALSLAGAALGTVGCGIALALALKHWPGVDAGLHAAGAQVAFRFNSFIALALAERLGGRPGLAQMALMIALCVPVCNVAAVWSLARHGGHHWGRELLRNPLIVSTVAGLAGNAVGLHLPAAMATTLQRIGLAALPVGLMAVGAGLKLGAVKAAPGLAATLLGLRHVVLPAIALGLAAWLALPPDQRVIVMLFAALPTSASTYVLAARMGANGAFVAGLVTLSTLFAMVSVPLWLALQAR